MTETTRTTPATAPAIEVLRRWVQGAGQGLSATGVIVLMAALFIYAGDMAYPAVLAAVSGVTTLGVGVSLYLAARR